MRLGNCEGGGFDNANRDTSMSKLEKAEGERVVTKGREPVGVVMWEGVGTDTHPCPSWRRRKRWEMLGTGAAGSQEAGGSHYGSGNIQYEL